MSKVIMGNGGFYGYLSEPKVFQRGGRKQHKHKFIFSRSLLLNCLEPQQLQLPQSSKARQTLNTHKANRLCRVRFYTFVGQPLSKQLYNKLRLHAEMLS